MTMHADLDRRIEVYRTRGWCPVPWSHHPPEIRSALRTIGMVPMMKECFRNSQRFLIYADRMNLGLEIEYREGWVQSLVPIEHAWLWYDGGVLDLTLRPDARSEYLCHTNYTVEEVLASVVRTGCWGPVDEQMIDSTNPMRAELRAQRAEWVRALGGEG